MPAIGSNQPTVARALPAGSAPAVRQAVPANFNDNTPGGGGLAKGRQVYQKLVNAFQNSSLNGVVPADGARWGITKGTPQEWARFATAVAGQESNFDSRSANTADPGGSFGIFQYNKQGQVPGNNPHNDDASINAFVRDTVDSVAHGGIQSPKGMLVQRFGSIRRPNEALSHMDEAGKIASSSGDTSNQGLAGGQVVQDTGTGPLVLQRMDRSILKTPSGKSDLSTQDEMNIAKAKMEDWVTNIEQGGGFVNQAQYNEQFGRFYAEAHNLNTPADPGKRIITSAQIAEKPTQAFATTKDIFQNPSSGSYEPQQTIVDVPPPQVKMPSLGMSAQDQTRYARSVTANWAKTLEDTGVNVNQEQATAFFDSALQGAQKIAIGVPMERLPDGTAKDASALFSSMDNLYDIQQKQAKFANSKSAQVGAQQGFQIVTGRPLPDWAQSDEYKALESARSASVGGFIQGLGHSTRMSEADIENTNTWLPNPTDSEAAGKLKTVSALAEHLRELRHTIDTAQIQHYDTGALEQQYQNYRQKFFQFGGVSSQLVGEPVAAADPTGDPKTTAAQSDATTAALNKLTGYTPPPALPPNQDKKIDFSVWSPSPPSPVEPGKSYTATTSTSEPARVPGQGDFQPVTAEAVGAPTDEQQQQQNQQNALNLF